MGDASQSANGIAPSQRSMRWGRRQDHGVDGADEAEHDKQVEPDGFGHGAA